MRFHNLYGTALAGIAMAAEDEGGSGSGGESGSGEPASTSQEIGQGAGQETGQSSSLLGGTPQPSGENASGQESGQGEGDAAPAQPGAGENSLLEQIKDTELRQDPNLQHIKSLEDLAKGYVHAQRLVGKDRIAVPSDENDTEAWNDVLSKLGRPEDPSGYELPELSDDSPAQLPEGTEDWFKNKAHELGLTNKQARELWGSYISEIAEGEAKQSQQRIEEMRQNTERELRQEWGNAFDDKISDANRALQTYGPEGIMEKVAATGMGNDPDFIKLMSSIGEQLREDKIGGSAQQFARTPDQAKEEIGQLKADKSFMQTYLDRSAAGHNEAVQRMHNLYKEAYPNG